jgi:hypothetical protein
MQIDLRSKVMNCIVFWPCRFKNRFKIQYPCHTWDHQCCLPGIDEKTKWPGHIVNCVNLTRFQILNYIILQYSGNLTISKPNTWMQIICTILPAHLVILSSHQYQVNNTDGLMYDRDIEFWICFWNDKVKRQCSQIARILQNNIIKYLKSCQINAINDVSGFRMQSKIGKFKI